MSVSINNVYQQVLAISNKEQRGYITPQEFNLFARKAQNEIFESTFQDYKDAYLNSEQFIGQHNSLNMLKEKMNPFKVEDNAVSVTSGVGEITLTAGTSVYWIENVKKREWLKQNRLREPFIRQFTSRLKNYFTNLGNGLKEDFAYCSTIMIQIRQNNAFNSLKVSNSVSKSVSKSFVFCILSNE